MGRVPPQPTGGRGNPIATFCVFAIACAVIVTGIFYGSVLLADHMEQTGKTFWHYRGEQDQGINHVQRNNRFF